MRELLSPEPSPRAAESRENGAPNRAGGSSAPFGSWPTGHTLPIEDDWSDGSRGAIWRMILAAMAIALFLFCMRVVGEANEAKPPRMEDFAGRWVLTEESMALVATAIPNAAQAMRGHCLYVWPDGRYALRSYPDTEEIGGSRHRFLSAEGTCALFIQGSGLALFEPGERRDSILFDVEGVPPFAEMSEWIGDRDHGLRLVLHRP